MRWTSEDGEIWNDLMMFMISFATERVNRGGDRMTPIGIRMLPVLDLAVGAGELRLVSNDPHVPPFLDYRYLEDERDLKRMREMVRLAIKLSEHPAFEPIIESRIEPTEDEAASDEALDVYILREISTGQHSSGTCKMGPASTGLGAFTPGTPPRHASAPRLRAARRRRVRPAAPRATPPAAAARDVPRRGRPAPRPSALGAHAGHQDRTAQRADVGRIESVAPTTTPTDPARAARHG